ncbi:helicase [Bifidobacterium amazonense]|uniref:Helicase n=1 Tax=Bifidobacterium amazonense TaxID=2809027 RepID=A0ABS9VU91_9BIFI|nr:helicase [Bifidobacterium amazonense]MCH9275669.1 helicase [Bifidobacterium amazonense]
MFKPWQARYPKRIRMIDAPTAGGGEPPADPGTNDAGEHVDWEAKYHDAMKHSREWENRAKANSDAADRLKAMEDAKLSETEKLTKRAEAAEKALADMKTAQERLDWKTAAAKVTGVPVDLIRGATEEEINAHAEALKTYLSTVSKPTAPNVPNPSGTPKTKTGKDNPNSLLLRQLFGTN